MSKRLNTKYQLISFLFIVLSVFFIGYTLISKNSILEINVKPASNTRLSEQPLATYGSNTVLAEGKLVIKNPSLAQKLMYPDNDDLDLLSNLVILVVAISIFMISNKINVSDPFKNNISKYLTVIGLAFISYFLLNKIRLYIIKGDILSMTNDEFTIIKNNSTATLTMWMGILILCIRLILRKGLLLQQEQDLTV
ncbi:MAG: DUF2975 domain-containing protein [Chitinophagaceae bacterium]